LEWGQKNKLNIEFNLTETYTDIEGNPVFQTNVLLEGTPLGIGIGNTKKESQQLAAKTAIRKINKDKEVRLLIENFKLHPHSHIDH